VNTHFIATKVVHIFITSKDKKTFFSVKGAVMGNFAKCSSQIAISREAISPYLCNIETNKPKRFMKLIKSIMSAFAIVLATTACAGNGGENKKSNEPTKEDYKMEVVSLNKAEFLKKVYDFEANPNDWKFEGKRPAIVDFYATWCGPCKALHPVLEELSKEYSGKVDIYQIDVDQEKELAAAFGIRSIPTLLLIPMKEEPRITQGALPKDQLKKAIDEFLLKQNNEAK
jgi:thioredoxin